MIRRKAVAGLTPWIERARVSLVASFANGVAKDEAAVRTGRVEQCSDTSGIEAKLEVPVHAQTEVNNEVKPSAR
jgi:hypothetical protein